jgi:predicted dehydrogenase
MSDGIIRIGLYGTNGHQLPVRLPEQVRARVTAVVFPEGAPAGADLPEWTRRGVSLDALLADPEIDLISLSSARREAQAEQAILCLKAGKHVLAEKPCAFDVGALEKIYRSAKASRREFREMGASELVPPLQAIRRLVKSGALGDVVHVQAQKSYPWRDSRPQDIGVDGGLVRQAGIHAVHFIHGAACTRMVRIRGVSTGKGNPGRGGIQMAAAFALELEKGGVGTLNLNYLNPRNFGVWGNDQLRVFGTRGMVETVDGFRRSALYLPERGEATDLPIPSDLPSPHYLEHYVNYLLDGTPMPTPFEEESAMTRAMLALHEASVSGECVTVEYPD